MSFALSERSALDRLKLKALGGMRKRKARGRGLIVA
jgi:hypothetical protein